jgi:recombination protein RecA
MKRKEGKISFLFLLKKENKNMAKEKTNESRDIKAFSNKMIENLNAKLGGKGKKIFYNLGEDKEDPAKIKRWYSTHSMLLNWICGAENQGMPGGRLVEIFGAESIGKSHICYQIARSIQEEGGIVLYIDTELATDVGNLQDLGIDVSDRFIYSKVDSIEGAFEAAEEFLKEVAPLEQSIPIGIIWDSIGGIGSRIEREMGFDDIQRPGLNAKQITFGIRKIMPAVNESAALFVLVNQEYDILNAQKFDTKKKETKGGKMIKYGSSVRLGISKVTDVYPDEIDKKKAFAEGIMPCGIKVRARTHKNKVASPFRSAEIDIIFGVGIKEHNTIWDMFIEAKEITIGGKIYQFGGGSWKKIEISDATTGEQLSEIKFRKNETEEILMNKHKDVTKECFDFLMKKRMQRGNKDANEYNPELDDSVETEDDIIGDLD